MHKHTIHAHTLTDISTCCLPIICLLFLHLQSQGGKKVEHDREYLKKEGINAGIEMLCNGR